MNTKCCLPIIYLGGNKIDLTKYLGVLLHYKMKITIDVSRQTRRLYVQVNMLIRNITHCSQDVKCMLFKTYCSNMYCCP